MLVLEDSLQKPLNALVCMLLLQISWIVYQRVFSPLARIPGPFWASVSRLWYVRRTAAGDMHKYTKALHEKYGASELFVNKYSQAKFSGLVVRIAPNEASCSDPEAARIIYAVNSGYTKVWAISF